MAHSEPAPALLESAALAVDNAGDGLAQSLLDATWLSCASAAAAGEQRQPCTRIFVGEPRGIHLFEQGAEGLSLLATEKSRFVERYSCGSLDGVLLTVEGALGAALQLRRWALSDEGSLRSQVVDLPDGWQLAASGGQPCMLSDTDRSVAVLLRDNAVGFVSLGEPLEKRLRFAMPEGMRLAPEPRWGVSDAQWALNLVDDSGTWRMLWQRDESLLRELARLQLSAELRMVLPGDSDGTWWTLERQAGIHAWWRWESGTEPRRVADASCGDELELPWLQQGLEVDAWRRPIGSKQALLMTARQGGLTGVREAALLVFDEGGCAQRVWSESELRAVSWSCDGQECAVVWLNLSGMQLWRGRLGEGL
ncbi:MAG: hypothetical protein RBU37_14140 [Myxococcota bacterium]|nr:hypothetical protein [Myxococcota bacterium]